MEDGKAASNSSSEISTGHVNSKSRSNSPLIDIKVGAEEAELKVTRPLERPELEFHSLE